MTFWDKLEDSDMASNWLRALSSSRLHWAVLKAVGN